MNIFMEMQSNIALFKCFRLNLAKIADESTPSRYHWLLLKHSFSTSIPQIKLWTFFIPAGKKIEGLNMDDPVSCYGAQLIAKASNTTSVYDIYGQSVNLGNYNPNYLRVEQDFLAGFKDSQGVPGDEQILNKLILDKFNLKRTVFEAWQFKLINAYRYLRQQSRSNIYNNMCFYLWDDFLNKIKQKNSKEKLGPQEVHPENEVAKEEVIHNSLLKDERLQLWKIAGTKDYSDLVALCRMGIPEELRSSVWSELLSLVEPNEEKNLKEKKTLFYKYYVHKSQSEDSIIYRQIEEDIKDIALTGGMQSSDETSLNNERAGVLTVTKAYYAWCLDENPNPKFPKNGPKNKKKACYGIKM